MNVSFAMPKDEDAGAPAERNAARRPASGPAGSLRRTDRTGRLLRLAVVVACAAIWIGLAVLIF